MKFRQTSKVLPLEKILASDLQSQDSKSTHKT